MSACFFLCLFTDQVKNTPVAWRLPRSGHDDVWNGAGARQPGHVARGHGAGAAERAADSRLAASTHAVDSISDNSVMMPSWKRPRTLVSCFCTFQARSRNGLVLH